MLLKHTVYTQTGIFKGHTNGLSSSSSSGQTTPDEPQGKNVPPVERVSTPELPSPKLTRLIIGEAEQPTGGLNVRLQELTTRVSNSETQILDMSRQMEGMQANIREHTGYMATMVTTVPALQATVSNLKTTIYNEATSRIRAAEQQTATTLQNYRREMNGSLNNKAVELRGTIRNLSLHIGELQSMPTHGALKETIRAETRALIDTQTEARETAFRVLTDRLNQLYASARWVTETGPDPAGGGPTATSAARPHSEHRNRPAAGPPPRGSHRSLSPDRSARAPCRGPTDDREEFTEELAQIRDELTTAYARYGRSRTEAERQVQRFNFMPGKANLRQEIAWVETERLGITPQQGQAHAAPPRKYHGWRSTWDTYHNNPSYTDSEKSQMLEAALEGEARTATASFTFSAESYANILQVLVDRFGNRNQVIGRHEALLRQAAGRPRGAESTAFELREKYIEVANHRQGLLDQGVLPATFNSHTAVKILRSLPHSITERWRFNWGINNAPTLDQVLQQLDDLIQVKSMEEATRQAFRPAVTQTNAAAEQISKTQHASINAAPRTVTQEEHGTA
ncbi:hypothetical protein DAPPUDRAFT_117664 [Daphnia pulex]|uniref:Uncharacterized protein n=1 Tax=Daphnia pulex TaxID=6669 RepID=E9HTE6_DAPPU|nr:hypothetical protein DAPPUDRAFT_117664 [Daphnia pulex]|eukprot:EFX64985.1 hypothetical protein DAPPUDRAFT_117664 [Daphnia pulex]